VSELVGPSFTGPINGVARFWPMLTGVQMF